MQKDLTFKDFFNHDEVAVSSAAQFLAEIQEKYEAGLITKSEFKELAADAVEIRSIYGLANDLDRKVAITRALNTLANIASFIPI